MQTITGLADPQLVDYELHAELAMREALQHVMDSIADRIAKIQVAAARVVWAGCPYGFHPAHSGPCNLIAADEPPPGQPYVSPDDLAEITPLWQAQVEQNLLPLVAEVWRTSAGTVQAQMVQATNVTLPSVGSLAAEQYLAQARNTFEEVGDHLWQTARSELSAGFEAGESIPQLAERLRGAAGLIAPTAVLVARTQVLDASNDGSIATARASGLELRKGWLSTPDPRTRPTHVTAGATYSGDSQMIPLGDKFTVGGYQCDRPHDPTLPPAERLNCRCTVIYGMPKAAVRQAARDAEPPAPLPGTSGTEQTAEPVSMPEPARHAEIRTSLAAARTVREVDKAAVAEARRMTGRDIRFDQTGSDVQIAREHAEGILRGFERYPDSPLSQIGTFGPGGSVPGFDEPKAFTATLPGNDVVLFNARMAGDPEAYHAALQRGADAGWHARGTATPMGQALHEFGHTVDETFTEAGAKIAAVRSKMTGGLYKDAVSSGVSRYAAESGHELGAEAFADVMMNGDQASAMSRAVFDAIDAGYRSKAGIRGLPSLPSLRGPGRTPPLPAPHVEVRPALAGARTTGAVSRVFREEFERVTGRPIFAEFRGSVATAREHAEGLLRGVERFPDAKIDSVTFSGFEPASSAYGHTRTGGLSPGGRVSFNDRWAATSSRQRYLDALADDVARGWHPVGTGNPTAVALHEFGHVIDVETVGRAIRIDLDELLQRRAVARDVGLTSRKAAGELTDPADYVAGNGVDGLIRREVSEYATKNRDELVAEAFADVMINGDQASVLSREIFDLLEAEYRRGGGVVRPAASPEVLPTAPAPKPLARMTVVELRAEASARGVTVPARAKKADIVRLLEAPPPDVGTGVAFEGDAVSSAVPRHVSPIEKSSGISDAASADLIRYSKGEFGPVNRVLRGTETATDDVAAARAAIARIDQTMESSNLTHDVVLYRGMQTREDRFGFHARGQDSLVGAEFTDSGYVSTSAYESSATSFARARPGRQADRYTMRLVAPRGTGAVEIRGVLDEYEVVLQRGLKFRVVGDRGLDAHGVRLLDVEIAPAEVRPVEIPLARRPVTELRALAKERGIPIPTGSRKPDIVRLLEAPPLTDAQRVAAERKALREATRAKFAQVQQATGTARLLAEVDRLLAAKVDKAVLRQALDEALIAPEQLFAGADPAALTALRQLADDPVKLRAMVTRLSTKAKLKPVGKAGARIVFDPETMESVGSDIAAGTQVTVISRGASVTLPDGSVVQVSKAKVTPVVKAAPAKRARRNTLRP